MNKIMTSHNNPAYGKYYGDLKVGYEFRKHGAHSFTVFDVGAINLDVVCQYCFTKDKINYGVECTLSPLSDPNTVNQTLVCGDCHGFTFQTKESLIDHYENELKRNAELSNKYNKLLKELHNA